MDVYINCNLELFNLINLQTKDTLKNALFLLPDISGFTKFVNQTGMLHGAHIIAELLEIIIKSNTLGLKVAEIEGDAVFFYKKGEKPTLEELYRQCEKMFLAFHQHLKTYDRDRICDCGSCSNTSKLTLKFVAHYGKVIERNILGHFQLMGADVTTAHKLMKNNIIEHEYFLFTDNTIRKSETSNLPNWLIIQPGYHNYKNIGKISYQYAYLTALLKEVPPAPKRKKLIVVSCPLVFKKSINSPLERAYELLVDIERKTEWVMGLKRVKYNANKIERIGTQHECVLPLNSLHIETVKNEIEENKTTYAENIDASGIYPAFSQVFILNKLTNNSCELIIEIHHISTFLKKLIFEMAMREAIKKSLMKFKQICEKTTDKRYK